MIETATGTAAGTGQIVITICNYDKYQTVGDAPGTTTGTATGTHCGTATGTRPGHDRDKLEEGNKEIKDTTPPPLVPNTAREAESHGGGGVPSGFVSKLIEACEPTAGHWSIAGAANWTQAALDQDWTTDDLLSAAAEGRRSLGDTPMQSLAYLAEILNRKARPAPAPGPAPVKSEGFAARVLAGEG